MGLQLSDFNPQGPRGPRPPAVCLPPLPRYFNPQGPRGPRRIMRWCKTSRRDFNPQGPRGPRHDDYMNQKQSYNFNPQGPRGPRRDVSLFIAWDTRFQSTRPSRASTLAKVPIAYLEDDFNPQGPRGPRLLCKCIIRVGQSISIHKALAGLDRRSAQK